MNRVLFALILLVACCRLDAADSGLDTIDGGKSPSGQFEVINVWRSSKLNSGFPITLRHFEIRNKSGEILVSELSLQDLLRSYNDSSDIHVFGDAHKVLWRSDSRFVAISTRTSKFATQTILLYFDGKTFSRVAIPEYEPFDEEHASFGSSDNTYREPYRWRKNGDLILDITMGYHTKSDGGITGYFATIHFKGNPPTASKGSETKATDRD